MLFAIIQGWLDLLKEGAQAIVFQGFFTGSTYTRASFKRGSSI